MSDLIIKTEKTLNNCVIIKLIGGIDAFVVSKLKDTITELVDKGDFRLILDLNDVTQINSTALGVIIGRLRRVRAGGGDIKLVNLNEKIKNIFDIMGASKVFSLFDNIDKAIKSFK
ncbi:MAG: STAS domain-containing protein [Candidatus Hydrogenedentota bacterium]